MDRNDLKSAIKRGVTLFENISFDGYDLSKMFLSGLTFMNCNFKYANLEGTVLEDIRFNNCILPDRLSILYRQEFEVKYAWGKPYIMHRGVRHYLTPRNYSRYFYGAICSHSSKERTYHYE